MCGPHGAAAMGVMGGGSGRAAHGTASDGDAATAAAAADAVAAAGAVTASGDAAASGDTAAAATGVRSGSGDGASSPAAPPAGANALVHAPAAATEQSANAADMSQPIVIVQGILPPLETPLAWLCEHLANPGTLRAHALRSQRPRRCARPTRHNTQRTAPHDADDWLHVVVRW